MNGTNRFVVAIDGPAGAGKSTLASRIGKRFGMLNLETGAMYRAFALKAVEKGISPDDAQGLEALAQGTVIRLEPSPEGNRVFLDGQEVTGKLRDGGITEAASRVSVHPAIREWMVAMQRRLGETGRIVMEGRDIGSVVFPDADIKIFLDAAPEVRGQRRYQQLEVGRPGDAEVLSGQPTAQVVLDEIRERDRRDRTRAQSPLQPAADAVVLDSTTLSLDEVVERVESILRERLSPASRPNLEPLAD